MPEMHNIGLMLYRKECIEKNVKEIQIWMKVINQLADLFFSQLSFTCIYGITLIYWI